MLVASAAAFAQSKVYLTREISPESLVRIYKALGVTAKGRVAVKMSTGEGSNPNYLKPELVRNLVLEVDGTVVECNTAYGNRPADKKDERNTSENHWKVIERHGWRCAEESLHRLCQPERQGLHPLGWQDGETRHEQALDARVRWQPGRIP